MTAGVGMVTKSGYRGHLSGSYKVNESVYGSKSSPVRRVVNEWSANEC